MRPGAPIATDLVLLGGGHAHVEVLRRLGQRPVPGLRVTLVAREPLTPYSGLLPAVIRGEIFPAQAHIDLARLAARSRARLIMAEAEGLDLASRRVLFAERAPLPFDLLSIDVGAAPSAPEGAIAVKPIGRFLARLGEIESGLSRGGRIAVVGGGAGGVELALALARRFAGRFALVLVSDRPEILFDAPPGARRIARVALARAGVSLAIGVPATGFSCGAVCLGNGETVAADAAIWATAVVGPPFLGDAGLACDEAGFVKVAPTLESLSHAHVFAAGDCAAMEGFPRPRAGVFAVRAGPVLAENLRAAAAGRKLRSWRPQREALAILGLGEGRALAWRGAHFCLSGRWVARWKERIDARWMAMYAPGAMGAMAAEEPMRCTGCGGKVGADALVEALVPLVEPARPDILAGLAAAEDAAVSAPPPGLVLVQSVDYLRAFLDDPFLFGEITAVHALSDLYAMGAEPWTALAIAGVPYMRGEKMAEELAALMAGAARALADAGCTLTGGHSAEAAELALGFSVTGLAEPGALFSKSALRAGDRLVLTKPLGIGILLAALPRGRLGAADLGAAIAVMRQSNAIAAGLFRRHGIRAATDVTGFGLAGHLIEMLRASNVAARLDLAAIPALSGALQLAESGIESSLAPANRAVLETALGGPPLAHRAVALLVDPETSGGLLAGVGAEASGDLLSDLAAAGLGAAAIGEVFPASEGAPRLRLM